MPPVLQVVLVALLAPPEPPSIPQLIEQLGSQSFLEREVATKKLVALHVDALPALQEAARAPRDLEVRKRAERIADGIQANFNAEESKKLQGNWRIVTVTDAGRKFDEHPQALYTFRDGSMYWTLRPPRNNLSP